MSKRWLWVLVVVALFGVGCSAGLSHTTSGPVSVAGSDAQIVALSESVLDLAGGESSVASAALLMAVDRGYAFALVREAVEGGNFLVEGFIVSDGVYVAPVAPDAGYIIDKPGFPADEQSLGDGGVVVEVTLASFGSLAAPAQGLGLSLDGLLTELDNADLAPPDEAQIDTSSWDNRPPQNKNPLVQVLGVAMLLNLGFSAEQVVDFVVFGEHLECEDWAGEGQNCTLDGVAPAFGPAPGPAIQEANDPTSVGEPLDVELVDDGLIGNGFYAGSFDARNEAMFANPAILEVMTVPEDVLTVEIIDGQLSSIDGVVNVVFDTFDGGCAWDMTWTINGLSGEPVAVLDGVESSVVVDWVELDGSCLDDGEWDEPEPGSDVVSMALLANGSDIAVTVAISPFGSMTADLVRQ